MFGNVDREDQAREHEHGRVHIGANDLRIFDVQRADRQEYRCEKPDAVPGKLAPEHVGERDAGDAARRDEPAVRQKDQAGVGIDRARKSCGIAPPSQHMSEANQRDIDNCQSIDRGGRGMAEPRRIERAFAEQV